MGSKPAYKVMNIFNFTDYSVESINFSGRLEYLIHCGDSYMAIYLAASVLNKAIQTFD